MIDEILTDIEGGMDKAIEAFKRDLGKVRTGRANLAMLDNVKVDYYGTPTPIAQVASVNIADARLLTIKPWEKNLLPEIEKAIRKSDLGLNPVTDSDLIRLPIPALTEERRKDLVKVIKKITEEAKVKVRGVRRDANDRVKSLEKSKEISEDESKSAQKDIQGVTDKFIKKVDEISANKEKETLEI